MMSFLKSILWEKAEKDQTIQNLSTNIELSQKKIENLEGEVEALKASMKEMTLCIQNITLVMHSLSQEVLTIVMAIKEVAYPAESDILSFGPSTDDDELLN